MSQIKDLAVELIELNEDIPTRRRFFVETDLTAEQVTEYFECTFPSPGEGKGSLVETLPDSKWDKCDTFGEIIELWDMKNRIQQLSGPHHGGAKQITDILNEMIAARKLRIIG